jgi:Tol biopolymer transport system component
MTVVLTLLGPPAAVAFYGSGAQIVSADFVRLEQGDDTTDFAAVSADGRYVAIQTRARNFFADDDPDPPGRFRAGGIFRFDLATKALEKVADGNLFDEEDPAHPLLRRGAFNPAISADGRYVAFATGEPLVAADVNDNVDVYVRDMAASLGAPGALDLVSARDGGDVPASYGPPETPFTGSKPGAELSRAVSISADGQKVLFRTDVASDLPASGAVDVPAGQLFLRDRATDTTTLVTAVWDPQAGTMTAEPAGGARGAAISADGTTVAWTGANAAAQTRFLGGENPEPTFLYYLWRRVADGAQGLTRRITGLADPDDPACPEDTLTLFDQSSTGPCYGPLTDQEGNRSGIGAQIPALSGDGYRVAFLTGAGPRPLAFTSPGLDLFLTDMTPGLRRKAATVELTRDTVGSDPATSPPLGSVSISASGRYLAITTVRTRFSLPALQLLGDPRQVPGPRELYVVDLQEHTLDRVTRAYWGGDIEADVDNGATLSADGQRVAFTSFSGNLFFGDANQRADAFVAERQPQQGSGQPPPAPGTGGVDTIETDRGGPGIGVRAQSKPDGVILLTVSVPAAGGVKAVAKAHAGTPRKLRTLGVATARARGSARSSVRMSLRPVSRYRDELRQRETIRGRVGVTYVASRGGRRAAASIGVLFRQEVGPRRQASGRQK